MLHTAVVLSATILFGLSIRALYNHALSVLHRRRHRIRHRNFIFGTYMHICPLYAHQIFSDFICPILVFVCSWLIVCQNQWRIQDFLLGRGAPTPMRTLLGKNGCENERIGSCWEQPLDPPMKMQMSSGPYGPILICWITFFGSLGINGHAKSVVARCKFT